MVEKKALQKRHPVTQSYSQKVTFNSIGYFTENKSQQESLCSLLREHDCSQCNVIFFFFFNRLQFLFCVYDIFAALSLSSVSLNKTRLSNNTYIFRKKKKKVPCL